MNRWAQEYPADYSAKVERALFGLPHDLFIRGKAKWLEGFIARNGLAAETILDIGCGIGLLHKYLPGKVTGVDVSTDALNEAAQRNPNADYKIYDGVTLPFPAESFDIVLAVTVMHHVPPPAWPDFVGQAVRMLRRGGAFVVIEHNPFNLLTRLSVAISELDHDAVLLSAKTSKGLLSQAGLKAIGCDQLHYIADLRNIPCGVQYAAYGFH